MHMTFRWFGSRDPVPLEHIAQIPGVTGIVTALHDIPPGEEWPLAALAELRDRIEAVGLRFLVAESLPVPEDIKLGRPTRDRLIEAYCRGIEHLGEIGVPVLCYNFMPIFDWMRTDLALARDDGSTTLAYDHEALTAFDPSRGSGDLPGWGAAYSPDELDALLAAYGDIDEGRLWDNLAWFLEHAVPVAAAAGVRLAIHPDDPPWPILGLPRIITTGNALERVIQIVDSPANGVTLCTGSLGAEPRNDVPAIVRRIGDLGRINFVHCRNVKVTGERRFQETPHPSEHGDVDMLDVVRGLHATGFDGPMRPDHGRMIWDETGRPGYGLHDRALGAMYLQGLWEAVSRQ